MANSMVREVLRSEAGASNLALNEKVRAKIASGQNLTHFGFGQSPFPPMNLAKKALQDNAHQTAYEPVQGQLFNYSIHIMKVFLHKNEK